VAEMPQRVMRVIAQLLRHLRARHSMEGIGDNYGSWFRCRSQSTSMSILKFLKIFYDAASIYKKDIIARLT
jgi:hypothetical protein